ncbi:hypothetical protein HWV62_17130 [Athelia sp. TMB]|nr:hypothetical protein HWV62_17130 [Athelia sp. TMB]
MSPWGYHHMHHFPRRFGGGPSRLVWFVLGGLTATWWAKRSEMHRALGDGQEHRFRWCSSAKYEHHHPHHQLPPPPPQQLQQQFQPPQPPQQQQQDQETSLQAQAPPPLYPQQQPQQQAPPWGFPPQPMPFGWSDRQWEEEKARMWALGQHAGDRMSDLSEATLENVLATVEALKAKVAEHKAQREAERREFQRQLDEQKKEPRHYV